MKLATRLHLCVALAIFSGCHHASDTSLSTPVVDGTTSTITVSTTTGLVADGMDSSRITVTILDANSNPIAGQTVTITASGSGNTIFPGSGVTDADRLGGPLLRHRHVHHMGQTRYGRKSSGGVVTGRVRRCWREA